MNAPRPSPFVPLVLTALFACRPSASANAAPPDRASTFVHGRVEASVYNPPATHVIIAVYRDGSGHVDAKAATPTT
jgi:hypothetical protein